MIKTGETLSVVRPILWTGFGMFEPVTITLFFPAFLTELSAFVVELISMAGGTGFGGGASARATVELRINATQASAGKLRQPLHFIVLDLLQLKLTRGKTYAFKPTLQVAFAQLPVTKM